MEPETIIERGREVEVAEMEDALALLDIESGNYYALEDASKLVWEFVEQPRSLAEICHLLTNHYKIEPDQCMAELEAFLKELAEHQLIVLKE